MRFRPRRRRMRLTVARLRPVVWAICRPVKRWRQLFDLLRPVFRDATWGAMRTRGTVLQTGRTFLLIAARPLGGGAGADVERGGRRVQRPLLEQNILR